MSTAPEALTTQNPPPSASAPSTLALLTATALGGVIGSRMDNAPLVLAAGATALALLNSNKRKPGPGAVRPVPTSESIPTTAATAPQEPVQEWLQRQLEREAAAAPVHVILDPQQNKAPEDDYSPASLLLDEHEPAASTPARRDDFADLTRPVVRAQTEAAIVAEPSFQQPAVAPTTPPPAATAATMLDVEPLPGWLEPLAPATEADPIMMPVLFPMPAYTASVFGGGSLPDEINVVAMAEPPQLPTAPVAAPPPVEPERASSPPARDIPVELAVEGEASFDQPWPVLPPNPWLAGQPSPFVESPPAPLPVASPVVEAEIVLRPRAPTQPTVVARPPPQPPRPVINATPTSPPPGEATGEPPAPLPPAPVRSPMEQRARRNWHSWWQGE